jgi:thiamine biosynthesis lipoprotein
MTRPARLAVSAALIAALLASFRLAGGGGAGRGGTGKFSTEFFGTFDTLVSFTAFASDEDEFKRYAEIVRGEMTRLHELFDIYNAYGGLPNMRTVNENAGVAPVKVDKSIIDLLEIAVDACDYTDGAVNVALGPVLSIWHDYRTKAPSDGTDATVPSKAELEAAASHISARDIEIDSEKSTVFLRYSDMRLDVGAVAKGYAARRAMELAVEAGLRSGLINAGGNVVASGPPMDGRESWNIGVHSPEGGKDAPNLLDVLYISGGAVVTSGNDQRYFTAGGRRYHHIIDPQTLYPAENAMSVTVLHPDSATADILSTAAFIMPHGKARELISAHGAEALWILPDGSRAATEGYLRLSKVIGGNTAAPEKSEAE